MTAAEMIQQLLIRIPQQFPAARVWRRNIGAQNEAGRFIRFGVPGEPDIEGIFPIERGHVFGVFLGVEVKAGKDRLSDKQKAFAAMITKAGGIWLECRDVDKCLKELEMYR